MPSRAVPPIDAAAACRSQYATYDEWLRRTRKAESQYWGSVSKRLSEHSVAGRPTPTDARFLACSTVYIHRHSGRRTMVVRSRGLRSPSEQHCGLPGCFYGHCVTIRVTFWHLPRDGCDRSLRHTLRHAPIKSRRFSLTVTIQKETKMPLISQQRYD